MLTPQTTEIILFSGAIETVHYTPAGTEDWAIDVWISYDRYGHEMHWTADGKCVTPFDRPNYNVVEVR